MSYDEGLAIHISPESCAGNGNIAGEALTGERMGQVLSREIPIFQEVTASIMQKIRAFSLGVEQSDDITIMVLRFKGSQK